LLFAVGEINETMAVKKRADVRLSVAVRTAPVAVFTEEKSGCQIIE
jgi:hypothetical protein